MALPFSVLCTRGIPKFWKRAPILSLNLLFLERLNRRLMLSQLWKFWSIWKRTFKKTHLRWNRLGAKWTDWVPGRGLSNHNKEKGMAPSQTDTFHGQGQVSWIPLKICIFTRDFHLNYQWQIAVANVICNHLA